MKKRILALLVAVSLMVTNLPLSPIVSAQGSEGTTAVVGTILSVPTSGDNAASGTMEGTELHNTDGQSLAIRHEDGGSFLVIDEAVATKGNTATSVTAKFFADTMNAAGLPASVALTENAAIAIRVKFNDNSTAITYNPAAFKVNLAKTGAVSALANTTVDHTNTAKWLDLGDASLTKMYPTDYATDSAVGYQFMGNMDGYMIIPLKLFGDGFAAADIMASFEALEIVPVSTYANDATAATDGTKYSTYKNRELLIGDIVLVNDVNAFVTEKTEGMTKYASGLNDTAYSGQTIRGYRNHYSTDGAVVGSTNKLDVTQKDISNPTTNATGGYIHMAVLSGGERAIAVKANEGVNISVRNNITYSYTTIDTYEGRNTNNTITGTASGIPSTVIENNNAGKLSGFAVRIYVANNEGKTLYVHPFYSKAFGNKGYYTLKPGDYTFISAETGRAATLTYTAAVNTTDPTGIAITGNLNGWIIIPNYTNTYWNCGSSAYEGDSIGAGIVGYGAYINGLTDYNQTVYFGDTLVVKNSEQFLNVRECCIGTPHVFDNVCDKTCNECRYVRDANHTREFNCSTECLVCGAPI